MKKSILIITVLLFAGLQGFTQDCFKYLPTEEGTKMETKHYDKKDRETATSTLTILKQTATGDEEKIDVKLESTSPEMDSVITNEYAYICKDGKLYVDMNPYFGNQLDAYQNMEIELDGDRLELPSNPVAGQKLPGGTVVAKVTNQGMPVMNISVSISNRRVEKVETIKTPAGEFKCFMIKQDAITKLGFIKVHSSSAEWIAEGAGIVRSESYNKKGKLVSYSVLNSISK